MSAITFGYLGCPSSSSEVTGSYTIPAGYFGVVTAACWSGGTFSIGGTTVLSAPNSSWNVLATSPVNYGTNGAVIDLAASAGGTGAPHGLAFASETAKTDNTAVGTYMIEDGKTINGSGSFAAHVALYPKVA